MDAIVVRHDISIDVVIVWILLTEMNKNLI